MKTLHGNFILFAEDNRLLTDTVEEVIIVQKVKAKKEHSPLLQYVLTNLTILNTFLHTVHHHFAN